MIADISNNLLVFSGQSYYLILLKELHNYDFHVILNKKKQVFSKERY